MDTLYYHSNSLSSAGHVTLSHWHDTYNFTVVGWHMRRVPDQPSLTFLTKSLCLEEALKVKRLYKQFLVLSLIIA